jgi:hypothetical protein
MLDTSASVRVRVIPVPAGRDHRGNPLVSPLRTVVPRRFEELLADVGSLSIMSWCIGWVQRFIPLLIDAAWPCPHAAGDFWFLDET